VALLKLDLPKLGAALLKLNCTPAVILGQTARQGDPRA